MTLFLQGTRWSHEDLTDHSFKEGSRRLVETRLQWCISVHAPHEDVSHLTAASAGPCSVWCWAPQQLLEGKDEYL